MLLSACYVQGLVGYGVGSARSLRKQAASETGSTTSMPLNPSRAANQKRSHTSRLINTGRSLTTEFRSNAIPYIDCWPSCYPIRVSNRMHAHFDTHLCFLKVRPADPESCLVTQHCCCCLSWGVRVMAFVSACGGNRAIQKCDRTREWVAAEQKRGDEN